MLTEKNKEVIRLIVKERLSNTDAYIRVYGKGTAKRNIKGQDVCAMLAKPEAKAYRKKLEDKIEEKVIQAAVWDRAKSTELYLYLLEQAKKEIREGVEYINSKGKKVRTKACLNMVNSNTAIQCGKQLDNIHGIDNPGSATFAPQITFIGEDNIKDED